MARRKEIYEALHPETKQHVAGAIGKHRPASAKFAFAEATSKATGKSRRSVENAARRGEALGEKTLERVKGIVPHWMNRSPKKASDPDARGFSRRSEKTRESRA